MTNNKRVDYNQKVLEVKNLRQYFKVGRGSSKLVIKAVDDISFDVYKREVLGLVGESGCGKTTTGRTIIKLYDPTDGTITFNGRSIGVGFSGHLHKIRKAREYTKLEVIKCNPQKYEIFLAREEFSKRKDKIEQAILDLKGQRKEEFNSVLENNKNIKTVISEVKRQYQLKKADYQFDFVNKLEEINNIGETKFIQKSKIEIKTIELRASKKIDYLHGALNISKKDKKVQIKEIQKETKHEVDKIKEKNQIEIANLGDLTSFRNQRVAKIAKAKELKKEQIANIRALYLKEKAELKTKKEPLIKIVVALKKVIFKYLSLINAQKKLIKAEKNAFHLKVKEIKEKVPSNPDLNKIAELKKDFYNIKKVEKEAIKKAKFDNSIRESIGEKEIRLGRIKAITRDYQIKLDDLNKQLQKLPQTSEEANQLKHEIKELNKNKNKEIKVINQNKIKHSTVMADMQMIFQDPIASLNPRMTVREIIAEGLYIQGIRDQKYIDQKVYEALDLVGLVEEHATRYPHEFSGGQRQRIGVARALVVNPSFIIADEPISALDVSIQAQVINLLNGLKEKLGLTILFIAHDLSVVKYFSDRIAVMYMGKIVELASSDELFAHPLHPYTKALLSAIPQPDPEYEKVRKRIVYNPLIHDYRIEKPALVEIKKDHFIFCNKKELAEYNNELSTYEVAK